MKKRILLFTAIAGFGYLTLSSYQTGPGANGWNCTGADANTGAGNPTGCAKSSCHGTAINTGITVTLELDSAGIPTSSTALGTGHYKPGFTYTVKITGTNTTANSLPYFGFQVSATKGAAAAASSSALVNVGTFQSSFTTNVHYVSAPGTSLTFYANCVEHDEPLPATTGSGGTGTTYVESFTWTAPVAGTGAVSLFGAVNAVNHNGSADAGDLSNVNHLVLNELVGPTGVANTPTGVTLKAFPNPVTDRLNLEMGNTQPGIYTIYVFDLAGKTIATENIEVTGNASQSNINTSNWFPGTYQVVVEKDSNRQVIPVVKL
jgi:hypothetical protein